MINGKLAKRLFEASYILRWNDMVRPVEMTELDKNAHKMIIAYCLGKYEEDNGKRIHWDSIIKGGLFELLRRVVLSDIKSPVYRKIKKQYPEAFMKLNKWVLKKLEPDLQGSEKIKAELSAYLNNEENYFDEMTNKILKAAHIYASYWEFKIIKQSSPYSLKIAEIDKSMQNDLEDHMDLTGMRKIITAQKISDFIDLCGQLRFQVRWGNTPRIPKTSVLGHMLLVACFAYLFSIEINPCPQRMYNNFFGGLFHDLPEVATRDILSPVKRTSVEMTRAIGKIEKELAKKEIYPLLEQGWIREFQYFTINEFKNKIIKDNKKKNVSSNDISEKYNTNKYNPIDGELIDVADKFSAFLEAYMSQSIGIKTKYIQDGLEIKKIYEKREIAGLSFYDLFHDFS
jgi:putative hydrolase of HD superfamily